MRAGRISQGTGLGAVLAKPGRDLWPAANPALCKRLLSPLTCLNPLLRCRLLSKHSEAAPGMLILAPASGTATVRARRPRRGPARRAGLGVPLAHPQEGTHRYSRENLVSSRLLCSHLNSRGQLPSAMQVSTRRFPSRCTWLRTGSVLK